MSGHSKWSTIKHKKAAIDAKRGALFTKLAREISVAAREGGGGDPNFNVRLRLAVDKARAANMPLDNIDRAIKKGLGVSQNGVSFEPALYEGYGPGGAAIFLTALTDNKNRTASEVRATFSRAGGNLGEAGSVGWMFESKAVVTVEEIDEEKAAEVALVAIDAGADDVRTEGGSLEITGPPSAFEPIVEAVRSSGFEPAQATVTNVPTTSMPLDEAASLQTLRLLDKLEDLDDIQQVFTNADFPDTALEKYGKE